MSAPGPGTPVLEDAAQAFAEATAKPPFLFDPPVAEGRATDDTAQDGSFPDPAASVEELTIDGGPTGTVHLTIYRPAGSVGVLPVVLYTHGAGWVFGAHPRPAGPGADDPRRSRHGFHELQPVPHRRPPERGRGPGHLGPLRRHDPRLRHAERAARHLRGQGGDHAGGEFLRATLWEG